MMPITVLSRSSRIWLFCLLAIMLALAGVLPALNAPTAQAQDTNAFPLPADLFILTSKSAVIRVDALTGEQTVISSDQQPVVDFDIAPDGAWWVYRSWANNGIVVETLDARGGYLLEFGETAAPPTTPRQTIAWAPNVAHIAYLIPGGARIADLGASEYGEAVFSSFAGDWVELYWENANAVIALDASDNSWRMTRTDPNQPGTWAVVPLGGTVARYAPPINAVLTPEGVQLADTGAVVPGTAGALAFDWGPVSFPQAFDGPAALPADVYYIAPDESGTDFLWRAPASGASPAKLIVATDPLFNYAPAPASAQIAVYGAGEVAVIDASGGNRLALATLSAPENEIATGVGGGLGWRSDGREIAYADAHGVWLVAADGSSAPRLLIAHTFPTDPAEGFNIRVYGNPIWSPDNTYLLVSIGHYEAGILGVIDVATGTLTELPGRTAFEGQWTSDGLILTWAAAFGYIQPGLYALDPSQPDADPQTILGTDTGVTGVMQRSGQWIVLTSSTTAFGPQFMRVLVAETLAGPYLPAYGPENGAFVQHARMFVPSGGPVMVVGLRNISYNQYGQPSGDAVVVDMATGVAWPILTAGPARQVRWGN